MKGLVIFLVLFFGVWDLAWLLAGLGQTPPWRLRRQMETKPPQLLDVRTPAEFALFHIPGAVNRPDALGVSTADLGLDPARPVVVICMTGHRSPFVAHKLAKDGLDASNLTWGMVGWLASMGSVSTGSNP
ncbi:MAG: rhodanese-like domain-containing protein [Acidobacteriota bacterium]